MGPKIDVMEREWKNFNFWSASKQGLNKKAASINFCQLLLHSLHEYSKLAPPYTATPLCTWQKISFSVLLIHHEQIKHEARSSSSHFPPKIRRSIQASTTVQLLYSSSRQAPEKYDEQQLHCAPFFFLASNKMQIGIRALRREVMDIQGSSVEV
jgi:hypothetical protein